MRQSGASVLPRLTPEERTRLVQAVFWCGTWPELRAVEQEIARTYAATPAQRAMNDEELRWLRTAASARREMVGKGTQQSGEQ